MRLALYSLVVGWLRLSGDGALTLCSGVATICRVTDRKMQLRLGFFIAVIVHYFLYSLPASKASIKGVLARCVHVNFWESVDCFVLCFYHDLWAYLNFLRRTWIVEGLGAFFQNFFGLKFAFTGQAAK